MSFCLVQGQNSSGTLALTPAWFLEVEPNHLTPPPPSRPPARLIYCSQWTRRPLKRCKFAVFVKRKVREPGGGPPTPLSLRQHSPRLWLTNQSREAVGGLGWVHLGGGRRPFYHLLKTAIGAKSPTRHDWMLHILFRRASVCRRSSPRKDETEKRL